MKIRELLNADKPTLSFEVFPPKKEADAEPIRRALGEISAIRPDFMSVTYGASGGTSKSTLEMASFLKDTCGTTALAHLTCVSFTPEELAAQLEKLHAAGIENILALRGDVPEGGAKPGSYAYASQLVEHIKKSGYDFCVGGACYPEGHVECANQDQDLENLKKKVDAGCEFLTTQMFFDNAALYSFLYRLREKDIRVPVIAGVMPVTNVKQISRITGLSGTTLPSRFRMIVDKFGHDPAAMKQAGIAYATEQIIDLVANGVKGIHVYTMNKPDVAASIAANLSHILGRA